MLTSDKWRRGKVDGKRRHDLGKLLVVALLCAVCFFSATWRPPFTTEASARPPSPFCLPPSP